MLSFYLIWSSCYLLALLLLGRSWKAPDSQSTPPKIDLRVSLLIPFRNEMKNLPALVNELIRIHGQFHEVILIDDHSEDGSEAFLRQELAGFSNIRILKNQGSGKKAAISLGVSLAAGEIICCSDADCAFQEGWPALISAPFKTASVQLVAGPVISLGSNSFFEGFQQVEWSSILLVTNYFFSRSKPLMCSAANMAYRKSAFESVNGYEGNLGHLSGDDEFLLKKITQSFSEGSCVYINAPTALVFTTSQVDWSALLQQRIRWASKWNIHRSLIHSFSTLFSFMIQLVWIGSLLMLGLGLEGIIVFLIVWIMKIVAERIALNQPLKTYGIDQKLINFIGTSFFHPLFVLLVGIGTWTGKFSWKGRGNDRSVILADKS